VFSSPTDAKTPLVYFGEDHEDGDLHHIRWGDFHHQLPAQPNIFEVNAWVGLNRRHILTFRVGEQYHCYTAVPSSWRFHHDTHNEWIGCVAGDFGAIQNAEGVETLQWHSGSITMPDATHEIDEDTICGIWNVGVWFVSRTQERGIEYLWWSNGLETKCTENRGENVEREGILLMRGQSGEVFVEDNFFPLSLHDHLLFRDNLVEHGEMRHIWKHLTRVGGPCYSAIASMDRLGPLVDKTHDGKIMNRTLLLWIEKEKRFLVYRALDRGAQTKVFPMYGPYFPTLAVVGPIDRREILGFMLVDSTLHIVRYPIW
jgi:hypothetical protein